MKLLRLTLLSLVLAGAARAQVVPPKDPNGQSVNLSYSATPLDLILEQYANLTGRILLKAPNVTPVTITLTSPKGQLLSPQEHLLALESVLALNNIALVPQGDKFLKVVVADAAQKEALRVRLKLPELPFTPTDDLVSQVVELKHLESAEIQPLVQELLHPYAKLQLLERNNAMLVTDTSANIQRLLDVLKYIDVAIESKEEPRIYQLKHAKAADVVARLNDLIAESQQELQRRGARAPISSSGTSPASAVRPAVPTPGGTPAPTNIIRAVPPSTGGGASGGGTSADAGGNYQGGLVNGKVKIVSDERTNIMIVISRPENFAFFDDMVEVLDRQVDPEMTVEVLRLEFSDAEEVSGILSDLIGSTSSSRRSSGGSSSRAASFRGSDNGGGSGGGNDTRNQSVRDFINRNTQETARATPLPGTPGSAAAGTDATGIANISENTRIIPDIRTNALLIMGRKEDIAILRLVVKQLDVMLAQVMLEALIIEVNLNDNVAYGVDWLQRSFQAVRQTNQGPNGGLAVTEPIFAWGGGQNFGTGAIQDGAAVTRATALNPGSLTYFGTFTDLNIDAVISLAAGDSDARVLSAPVILTTDNTEASINVGERRPIPSTTQNTGVNGTLRTSVEYENIGIQLQVKPRISPNRVVVMEVQQSVDNVGGTVTIDGNEVPIITTRELEASITMTNKTTLVLGGLVSEDTRDSHTKVPFLGDIPILGNLFRSTRKVKNRTELLILLTPHVIMSVEDAQAETERLHRATKLQNGSRLNGWSENSLEPVAEDLEDKKVPLRRYRNQVEELRAEKEAVRQAELNRLGSPAGPSGDATIRIPPAQIPHATGSAPAEKPGVSFIPFNARKPAPEPEGPVASPPDAAPGPAVPAPAVPVEPPPGVPSTPPPALPAGPGNASLIRLPASGTALRAPVQELVVIPPDAP